MNKTLIIGFQENFAEMGSSRSERLFKRVTRVSICAHYRRIYTLIIHQQQTFAVNAVSRRDYITRYTALRTLSNIALLRLAISFIVIPLSGRSPRDVVFISLHV